MAAVPSRADDERLLAWLASTKAGQRTDAIAARWGVKPRGINAAVARVRTADLAESGEPKRVVLAGYR